jgi:hypothetical protein
MQQHWDEIGKRWVEHRCGNCALWGRNFYARPSDTTCCADAKMELPASFIPARQTMTAEQGEDCICWEAANV